MRVPNQRPNQSQPQTGQRAKGNIIYGRPPKNINPGSNWFLEQFLKEQKLQNRHKLEQQMNYKDGHSQQLHALI